MMKYLPPYVPTPTRLTPLSLREVLTKNFVPYLKRMSSSFLKFNLPNVLRDFKLKEPCQVLT